MKLGKETQSVARFKQTGNFLDMVDDTLNVQNEFEVLNPSQTRQCVLYACLEWPC